MLDDVAIWCDGQVPFRHVRIHESDIVITVNGRKTPGATAGFDCENDCDVVFAFNQVELFAYLFTHGFK
jgi:hypothetical protein